MFLILLIGFSIIPLAYACECMPQTMEEKMQNNEMIFSGQVSSIIQSEFENTVEVKISNMWKGNFKEIIQVTTDKSDCGIVFVENEHYIIYAKNIDGELKTDRCDGTRPLEKASEDIEFLNSVSNYSFDLNIILVIFGIVGAGIIIALTFWKKYTSRKK